jgi:branched-subunit amino acid transport protein AzlD
MTLSVGQSLLIIFVCAVCTQLERALPFLVFKGRSVPKVIRYLGEILPMAVMATLVIYCLRGITFTAAENFAPQLIAVAVTVALHLWRRNTLLSIFGGTACYMLLVQLVF